jgi:hypothetical protein
MLDLGTVMPDCTGGGVRSVPLPGKHPATRHSVTPLLQNIRVAALFL